LCAKCSTTLLPGRPIRVFLSFRGAHRARQGAVRLHHRRDHRDVRQGILSLRQVRPTRPVEAE